MDITKKDYSFIHLGRIVACLAVISIHAFAWNTVTLISGPITDWWAQQIILSFTIWAVPLFIMMSGALLLRPSKETDWEFYEKRFLRIGIPTFIWLGIYALFFHFQRGDILTWESLLMKPLIGPFEHLYFLLILIGLAVLTPKLRRFVATLRRGDLLLLCLFLFVVSAFWQRSRFSGTMFVPYLGYYLWGAWLLNWKQNFQWRTLISIGLTLALGTLLATVLLTHWNETWYVQDPLFFRHWNPVVAAFATIIWLILRKIESEPWAQKALHSAKVAVWAEATLGMYLVFLIVQASLISLWSTVDLRWFHSLLLIPITVVCSYILVSYKKSPFLTMLAKEGTDRN